MANDKAGYAHCQLCNSKILDGDAGVMDCPKCNHLYHIECWGQHGGCSNSVCSASSEVNTLVPVRQAMPKDVEASELLLVAAFAGLTLFCMVLSGIDMLCSEFMFIHHQRFYLNSFRDEEGQRHYIDPGDLQMDDMISSDLEDEEDAPAGYAIPEPVRISEAWKSHEVNDQLHSQLRNLIELNDLKMEECRRLSCTKGRDENDEALELLERYYQGRLQ